MMVTFSKHTGSDDDSGIGAIIYMTATETMRQMPDGSRQLEIRDPAPEILRGSPELMRRAISSISYACRYSSGVLSFASEDVDVARFNAGDRELRRVIDALIDDFEDTIFAGIPRQFRPPMLWTTHTHTGRLELNFLTPRALLSGKPAARSQRSRAKDLGVDGAIRSFNPHPPGRASRDLLDAFRDKWNLTQDWADPGDPERKQALKLPDHVIKQDRNAARIGEASRAKLPEEQLQDIVYDWIRDGRVQDRSGLLTELQRSGYSVPRKGEDYLTLLSSGPQPPDYPRFAKRTRLRGALWSRAFVTREFALALIDPAPRQKRPSRLNRDEVRSRLTRLKKQRADFHQARYGGPGWQDVEVFFSPPVVIRERERQRDNPGIEGATAACSISPDPDVGSSYKAKLWQSLYKMDLPTALARELAYVDVKARSVRLKDGIRLVDHGDRLTATGRSDAAVTLMALEALGKGWQNCKIEGDEVFLRKMTRVCNGLGIGVCAPTPEMQAIVTDELGRCHAASLPESEDDVRPNRLPADIEAPVEPPEKSKEISPADALSAPAPDSAAAAREPGQP